MPCIKIFGEATTSEVHSGMNHAFKALKDLCESVQVWPAHAIIRKETIERCLLTKRGQLKFHALDHVSNVRRHRNHDCISHTSLSTSSCLRSVQLLTREQHR